MLYPQRGQTSLFPRILATIAGTPAASNKMPSKILASFGKPYTITESMLQDARTGARAELFWKSEENIKYAESIKYALEKSSHNIQLHFANRQQCLKNLHTILISDEITCQNQLDGMTIKPSDQKILWFELGIVLFILLILCLLVRDQNMLSTFWEELALYP